MNSIFGVGLAELVLILLLAGLLLGPQHIRQISHKLGLYLAKLQKEVLQIRQGLKQELRAADTPEMRETLEELRKLQEQVRSLQQQIHAPLDPDQILRPNSLSGGRYANKASLFPEGSRDWFNLPDDKPERSIAPPPNLPKLVDVPDDPTPQE
jgi:Sec-independent protein translocase protein TatA